MTSFKRAALAGTAVLSLFALAACGSDNSSDTSTSSGAAATTGGSDTTAASDSGEAKQGGTMTGYLTSSPDYMDPALSYTQEG